MTTVKITFLALSAILSIPDCLVSKARLLHVGDTLEVVDLVTREEDNVDFLKLKYQEETFYVQASFFEFDIEAYKAEKAKEEVERAKRHYKEMRQKEYQEFLEHYDWDGLRCRAAVAAMQGFIINDKGSRENNMKYLVSASVQVATALVKELQETV